MRREGREVGVVVSNPTALRQGNEDLNVPIILISLHTSQATPTIIIGINKSKFSIDMAYDCFL